MPATTAIAAGTYTLDTARSHDRLEPQDHVGHGHVTITFTVRNATLGTDGETVTVDGQLTIRGVVRCRQQRPGQPFRCSP